MRKQCLSKGVLRTILFFGITSFLVLGASNKTYAQEQFLGEIRMFAGTFAPSGWRICDGSLLQIRQNTALFSLLGTMYGGDGRETFAIPDLRGRFPMGTGAPNYGGNNVMPGSVGGRREVGLQVINLPAHSHSINVSTEKGDTDDPTGSVIAVGETPDLYKIKSFNKKTPNATLSPSTVSPAGQGLPVNVTNPYTGINFIICVQGAFPSRP